MMGKILIILFLFLALLALMPLLTQWSWSNSVTPVLGIREITFWEAFFFNMLGTALFKNTSVNWKKD